MKYLLCVLFATLYVAVSADDIMEKEGHYFDMRVRTGHFNEYPYADLFKNYVQVFIAPAYKGTRVHETDSYKNYAASAEHCFNVFDQFRENDYELEKIEKLVELDSCLGYLYDDEYVTRYHAIDKARDIVNEKLDDYINDPQLKALYDGTKVHELEQDAKVCISELLLKTIQIKQQFPDLACNNHHIELLNRFGDCHKTIPEDARTSDTYISTLYRLIKTKGKECFEHELLATNDAIRAKYSNNLWHRVPGWTPQSKQVSYRMWPEPMRKLLAAVQGAKSDDLINLREILAFAKATYELKDKPENAKFVRNLLTNLATYANKHVDLKKVPKSFGSQDEDGRLRYVHMINNLCYFFRTTDVEDTYDYATAFARLVHMLDFPELFDINKKKFIDTVINGYETAPTYTSIMMCNIISFTQGTIKRENRKSAYQVTFKKDCKAMVKWPEVGFY